MTTDTAPPALVTGASSGIGAAVARGLAAAGHPVVLCGRNAGRLAAVAADIAGPVHSVLVDLDDAGAVANLPAALPPPFAGIAILVNAAGHDVGGRRPFEEGSADDWAGIIDTNLTSLIRLTHAVVTGMIARGGHGDIVNIGSVAPLRPAARMTAYVASKAGVHAFSDILRADMLRHGIRVMEIMPGLARTGFAEARLRGDAQAAAAFYDKVPTSLSPEDVAEAVIHALQLPRHVTVAQLVLMPSSQW